VIVTGGYGYIGAITAVQLASRGYDVICVDNLSRTSKKVGFLIDKLVPHGHFFYNSDVSNLVEFDDVVKRHSNVTSIIHFASFKSVSESISHPGLYIKNNVNSTNVAVQLATKYSLDFVFSSSCTVYGDSELLPASEDSTPISPNNPYAFSKVVGEELLQFACGCNGLRGVALRYFNPVGAHQSGLLGEIPGPFKDNIFSKITSVTSKKEPEFLIFGSDYDTVDGTCLRDYIHVMDVAEAHIAALEFLRSQPEHFYDVFNIGRGRPVSVLEILGSFNKVGNIKIPVKTVGRRAGDIARSWADTSKCQSRLGWSAQANIDDMVESTLKWTNFYREFSL